MTTAGFLREHIDVAYELGKFNDHTIQTPWSLVDEIVDQIDVMDSALVLYNPEFVWALHERGWQLDSITLFADSPSKKKWADKIGINYITDLEGLDMKFDVVVGNPPFSMVNKETGRGRGIDLYPAFYADALEMAPIVAMIMPSTHDRVFAKHNSVLRKTANKIVHIDPKVFDIARNTWYVIRDGSGDVPDVEWLFNDENTNDIDFAKGKLNVTTDKGLLGRTSENANDVAIYHKITGAAGLVTNYCNEKLVPLKKRFPKSGYAVLMPQQITKKGWPAVEIVKCNGNQAAMNGMNIAFFKTKKEANRFVAYMNTSEFIDEALKYMGGMGNMTLTAMKMINLDKFKVSMDNF